MEKYYTDEELLLKMTDELEIDPEFGPMMSEKKLKELAFDIRTPPEKAKILEGLVKKLSKFKLENGIGKPK